MTTYSKSLPLNDLTCDCPDHPGIANVYEYGTVSVNGEVISYLVMEFVDGCPISNYVKTESITSEQRLNLLAQICHIVQYAHQNCVIHRDLKPDNILVTKEGRPVVIDFGVAKLDDASTLAATIKTCDGDLLGTLNYMSPEQCSGDPSGTDARCDVYALGVIGYQLLSGNLPYDFTEKATILDAIRTVCDQNPPLIGKTHREFRGDVEAIISKAMSKNKEERYASAVEFSDDIRRYLNSEPVRARHQTATYQVSKFVVRNKKKVFGIGASFVTTAMALLIGVLMLLGERNKTEQKNDELVSLLSVVSQEHQDLRPSTAPEFNHNLRMLSSLVHKTRDVDLVTLIYLHDKMAELFGENMMRQFELSHRKRCFELTHRLFGIDDTRTLRAVELYAEALISLKRFAQAESLILLTLDDCGFKNQSSLFSHQPSADETSMIRFIRYLKLARVLGKSKYLMGEFANAKYILKLTLNRVENFDRSGIDIHPHQYDLEVLRQFINTMRQSTSQAGIDSAR